VRATLGPVPDEQPTDDAAARATSIDAEIIVREAAARDLATAGQRTEAVAAYLGLAHDVLERAPEFEHLHPAFARRLIRRGVDTYRLAFAVAERDRTAPDPRVNSSDIATQMVDDLVAYPATSATAQEFSHRVLTLLDTVFRKVETHQPARAEALAAVGERACLYRLESLGADRHPRHASWASVARWTERRTKMWLAQDDKKEAALHMSDVAIHWRNVPDLDRAWDFATLAVATSEPDDVGTMATTLGTAAEVASTSQQRAWTKRRLDALVAEADPALLAPLTSRIGAAYARIGYLDDALHFFEQAHAPTPTSLTPTRDVEYLRALRQAGHTERALDLHRTRAADHVHHTIEDRLASSWQPSDAALEHEYGLTLLAVGRHTNAFHALRNAISFRLAAGHFGDEEPVRGVGRDPVRDLVEAAFVVGELGVVQETIDLVTETYAARADAFLTGDLDLWRGDLAQARGDDPSPLWERALAAYQIGQAGTEADRALRIGDAQRRLDPETALAPLTDAIDGFRRENRGERAATALRIRAEVHLTLGPRDAAIADFTASTSAFRACGQATHAFITTIRTNTLGRGIE